MSRNNHGNMDEQIPEDIPHMRSVALHSAPPIPLARSFPAPKAFSTVAPSRSHVTAPVKATNKPDWRIKNVLPVPPMYFLERTHVLVSDASPQQIAARIVDCMQRESVRAVYDDRENCITAETKEHVEFMIRLWAKDNGTIVEVQRAGGCGFVFHQIARAVLRAAKGLRSPSPPKTRMDLPIPKGVPLSNEEEKKESWDEGLENACSLLKSDRIDCQFMAIESLVHLTNVCKCPVFTANSILCDEVLRTLLCLVEFSRLSTHDRESCVSEMEENNLSIMHRNALTVLANCLSALSEAGDLCKVVDDVCNLRSSSLLEALVEDVHCSSNRPHDACQAIRCLHCLITASSEIQEKMQELHVVQALECACQCRHSNLGEVSEKLRLCIDDL